MRRPRPRRGIAASRRSMPAGGRRCRDTSTRTAGSGSASPAEWGARSPRLREASAPVRACFSLTHSTALYRFGSEAALDQPPPGRMRQCLEPQAVGRTGLAVAPPDDGCVVFHRRLPVREGDLETQLLTRPEPVVGDDADAVPRDIQRGGREPVRAGIADDLQPYRDAGLRSPVEDAPVLRVDPAHNALLDVAVEVHE